MSRLQHPTGNQLVIGLDHARQAQAVLTGQLANGRHTRAGADAMGVDPAHEVRHELPDHGLDNVAINLQVHGWHSWLSVLEFLANS
ncbi:hypothetical protein D3C76_1423880 [compost metagenome]